jgi:hypothetical protein
MLITRYPRLAGLLAAAAVIAAFATGCTSSSSGTAGAHASAAASAGRSAAAALTNSPCYTADKTRLETELTANFQKHFDPHHPITSTESAVRETFPHGDTAKIVDHAVTTFTLAAAHKGPARDAWIQGTVDFALTQGGQPVASPSPGSASVPGYPASCVTVTPKASAS